MSAQTPNVTQGPITRSETGARVNAVAEWRSKLTAITGALLLFVSVSGLLIYLLPFSVFSQLSVVVHTVIGVIMVLPVGWYTLRQGRNTRALGARVEIHAGDMRQAAQVGVDGGYLSQHELDLHFGLGAITPMIDQLRIEWPDGEVATYRDLQVDRVHTFTHTPDYSPTSSAKNR